MQAILNISTGVIYKQALSVPMMVIYLGNYLMRKLSEEQTKSFPWQLLIREAAVRDLRERRCQDLAQTGGSWFANPEDDGVEV